MPLNLTRLTSLSLSTFSLSLSQRLFSLISPNVSSLSSLPTSLLSHLSQRLFSLIFLNLHRRSVHRTPLLPSTFERSDALFFIVHQPRLLSSTFERSDATKLPSPPASTRVFVPPLLRLRSRLFVDEFIRFFFVFVSFFGFFFRFLDMNFFSFFLLVHHTSASRSSTVVCYQL